MNHQNDRDEADPDIAREAERYRNRVRKGEETSRKAGDKPPYTEAQKTDVKPGAT